MELNIFCISFVCNLQELGVDYLWLTPFFISPQRDNGYDVADYRKINPQFGTMEDLENLIMQSKKRNIGIMLDMVFNPPTVTKSSIPASFTSSFK